MEEIAEVYARSLFEVAQERDKLDDVREQLGQFADALDGEPRPAGLLLLAVLLDARRRRTGWASSLDGADDAVTNFLELLVEKHRMPAIFRIRREFDSLWAEENKLLPVTDHLRHRARRARPSTASARRSASRPAARSSSPPTSTRTSSAASSCASATPILDASIRNRLEKLRRQVAKAA